MSRPTIRRRRGFTLVETMFAMGFFTVLIAILAWMTVATTKWGNVVQNSSKLQSDARLRLDTFIQDVRDSAFVLSTYTTGGRTYTSNNTSTLILQAPSVNSAGTILPNSYDYIVYRLVGNAAPYTLNRLVVSATGSARPSSADKVLARNVTSIKFTCLVDENLKSSGDSSYQIHGDVAPGGNGMVQMISVDGVAMSLDPAVNQARFVAPSNNLTPWRIAFTTPPANGAQIDTLYSVDPSEPQNQPDITGVAVDLTLSVTNPGMGSQATQMSEITGRANLHNHP